MSFVFVSALTTEIVSRNVERTIRVKDNTGMGYLCMFLFILFNSYTKTRKRTELVIPKIDTIKWCA